MNAEYNRLAYRLAILDTLEAHLRDTYLGEDGPSCPKILSEHVFFKDRFVTEDALTEFIYDLQVQQGELKEALQRLRTQETKGDGKDDTRKPTRRAADPKGKPQGPDGADGTAPK